MRKEYNIKGISCENCKNEIEEKIKNQKDVKEFSINLMTNKMIIDSENQDDVIMQVKKEEDVQITEVDSKNHNIHNHDHDHENKTMIKLIIIGFLLLLVSFFFEGPIINTILIIDYIIVGKKVIIKAFKNLFKGKIFDEFFLMTLATLAAISIGEVREAVFVMIFYMVGEYFQHRGVEKSKDSIKTLLDLQINKVLKKQGNEFIEVDPSLVKVGDIIKILPGQKVGLDSKIIKGSSAIQTKALTGESTPKVYKKGDKILAGMIVEDQVLECEVLKVYSDSSIFKMLKIVQEASNKKAKTEKTITTFAKYYTPTVVILSILLVIILPLFGMSVQEAISRAVILLVISCPCALVLSVPLTYFVTLGRASREGMLIKGATYIDAINQVNTLVVDKTGTLTKGNFVVDDINYHSKADRGYLWDILALVEQNSTHPIAKSIMKYYKDSMHKNVHNLKLKQDVVEIKGLGLKGKIEGQDILVGKKELLESEDIKVYAENTNYTTIYMAINKQHVLTLKIKDQIKEDSKKALELIRDKYKKIEDIIMLTGDNQEVAKQVAKDLNIKTYKANLLPEDKVEYVKELINNNKKVMFVGDGINDVPVMLISNVGVSMGNLGSDIAIENSDVVINNDSLMTLLKGFDISSKGLKIVRQNIVLAISIKIFFITLGMLGLATMWEAIFSDVGITCLAILNSLRINKK